jgi:hypothetical protein
MSYSRFMNAKVPADVVERAKAIAPIMNTTIGEILATATRPALDLLEKEALSRFQAKVDENGRHAK